MKRKALFIVLAMALLVGIPASGYSALVYEMTDWIRGEDGLSFQFTADSGPYTYQATLSDISTAPYFGFDFLFFQIVTDDVDVSSLVDLDVGFSTLTFDVSPGQIINALIYGVGQQDTEFISSGAFRLQVQAVPIPASLLLLGSGLVALTAMKRKKLQ